MIILKKTITYKLLREIKMPFKRYKEHCKNPIIKNDKARTNSLYVAFNKAEHEQLADRAIEHDISMATAIHKIVIGEHPALSKDKGTPILDRLDEAVENKKKGKVSKAINIDKYR
jgi:hypothetical protein